MKACEFEFQKKFPLLYSTSKHLRSMIHFRLRLQNNKGGSMRKRERRHVCACERMKRETEGKRKWVWRILRKQFTVIRKGKQELATTRPRGRRRSKVGAHIGVDISNVTLSDTHLLYGIFCYR